ncbi:MAG: hypothetical protein KDD82_24160 [Planctomycetes bacterium]|nr:hypothetical protein [Planctomycetota bacterium]
MTRGFWIGAAALAPMVWASAACAQGRAGAAKQEPGGMGLVGSLTGEAGSGRRSHPPACGDLRRDGAGPHGVPITRELSVSERRVASAAYERAKVLLGRSRALVADDAQWQARGEALAETWFGSADAYTRRKILEGIDRMLAKKAYLGHGSNVPNAVAFVHPAWPSTIHVTDAFFEEPSEERKERAGTMVHELSHFADTLDTDDVKFTSMLECGEGNSFSNACVGLEAYGRRYASKLLARKRMKNADNWAFFVLDTAK